MTANELRRVRSTPGCRLKIWHEKLTKVELIFMFLSLKEVFQKLDEKKFLTVLMKKNCSGLQISRGFLFNSGEMIISSHEVL